MRWSDSALEKFTAALKQAREEGCRGQAALNRAYAILWPVAPTCSIDRAICDDDVDFEKLTCLL